MSGTTRLALTVTLLVYPSLRAAEFEFYLTGNGQDWWRFWGVTMLGHWLCFGVVAWSLRADQERWSSLGVDWGWFRRHRGLLLLGAGLLVGAVVAVSLLVESPARTGLFPLQATSLPERLFMLLGAVVTAGVVEEVVFRGFALTRLGQLLGSPWWALPLSMVSFLLLHGTPSDPARTASILVFGLLFGAVFILLRRRRLEYLILLHGLLNLPLLFLR